MTQQGEEKTVNLPCRKILIVDDNEVFLQLFRTKLFGCGFSVVTANSGIEAIRKFTRDSFDLVLTDIYMPGLNGNILARYIRNVSKDVPVIAVTAAPWLANESFDMVIEKPFELKFLMDSMEYYLSDNSEQPEPCEVKYCG